MEKLEVHEKEMEKKVDQVSERIAKRFGYE
jgi:hypothetical protein